MRSIDDTTYWNDYYQKLKDRELLLPSQFATFVAAECGDAHVIVDVGCGNGRDSLFFSKLFGSVVGLDSSEGAVQSCVGQAEKLSLSNVKFHRSSVESDDFLEVLKSVCRDNMGRKIVVYSRFFVHALNEEGETAFFDALSAALRPGDGVALEYRTVRDSSGAKFTPQHYRRFVSPPNVYSKLEARAFKLMYAVEGFGMAKYRVDDAYVARSLHEKI